MRKRVSHKARHLGLDITIGILALSHFTLFTAIVVMQKKNAFLEAELAGSEEREKETAPAVAVSENPSWEEHREGGDLPKNPKNSAEPGNSYQEGKLVSAIEERKERLETRAKDPEAHLALGQVYMADRKYRKEALFHLEKVLEISPNHPRRKNIELWIQSLKEVETQTVSRASEEKTVEMLKSRLANESDPLQKRRIEKILERLEK